LTGDIPNKIMLFT